MAYSLLAHLYPHIKGSQEDIATYSLQYLLGQSEELNRAFTQRISEILDVKLDDTLLYNSQVTGNSNEKERPDMSAVDNNGNEVVLCEMKFYAALTANQPGTYLKRLNEERGKGLLFICPETRKTSLWAKLQELCSEKEVKTISDICVSVNGIKMGIITWTEIINLLNKVASSVAIEYAADITQLEGYCNQLCSEAFIPFNAIDLSAESALKADRYYQVIDEIIELLCADKSIRTSKKGVKATGYRKGYTRSLSLDDFKITLNYDRDLWKSPSTVETPFWVAIRDDNWKQTEKFTKAFNSIPEQKKETLWGYVFLSLEPIQDVTFPEVCEDLKNKILAYVNLIR